MYYKIENSLKRKEVGRFPQCEKALWNGQRFANDSFAHNGKFEPLIGSPALPMPILHKKAKLIDYLSISMINRNLYKIITPVFYEFLETWLDENQTWNIKVSNDVYKFDIINVRYVLKENVIQECYNYKILHLNYPENDFIDYKQSVFYLYKKYNEFVDFDQDKTLNEFLRTRYEKDSLELGQKIKIPKKIIIEDNLKIKSKGELRFLNDSLIKTPLGKLNDIPKLGIKKIAFNCNNFNKDIFRVFIRPGLGINGYYVSENLKNKILEKGFTGIDFKPLEKLNPHIDIVII